VYLYKRECAINKTQHTHTRTANIAKQYKNQMFSNTNTEGVQKLSLSCSLFLPYVLCMQVKKKRKNKSKSKDKHVYPRERALSHSLSLSSASNMLHATIAIHVHHLHICLLSWFCISIRNSRFCCCQAKF